MKKPKAKYGFLTSYNETIFLKQEKKASSNDKWVLYCSPAIAHNTLWSLTPPWAHPYEFEGKRKVTLRECFLYIIDLGWQQQMASNTMADSDWIQPASATISLGVIQNPT